MLQIDRHMGGGQPIAGALRPLDEHEGLGRRLAADYDKLSRRYRAQP